MVLFLRGRVGKGNGYYLVFEGEEMLRFPRSAQGFGIAQPEGETRASMALERRKGGNAGRRCDGVVRIRKNEKTLGVKMEYAIHPVQDRRKRNRPLTRKEGRE